MDGSLKLLAPALLVWRDFAGTRLEAQLLASVYDRLSPSVLDSHRGEHAPAGTPATNSWPRPEAAAANEFISSRGGA